MTNPEDRETLARWRRLWDGQAARHADPTAADGWFFPGGSRFPDDLMTAVLVEIRRKLRPRPGDRLIEVGCGAGALLRPLSHEVRLAVGLDLSPGMLAKARDHAPRASILLGEAGALPFRDGAFDRVLCYNVFPSFPSQSYAYATLREIARVLAPGGRALAGDIQDADRLVEAKAFGRAARLARYPAWKRALRPLLGPPWRLARRIVGRGPPPPDDIPPWIALTRDEAVQAFAGTGVRAAVVDQDIPGKYSTPFRFDIVVEREAVAN